MPTHVAIDPVAFQLSMRRTGNPNALFAIEVEGEEQVHTCVVREFQRHPLSRNLLHVDFYEVREDQPITLEVPVHTRGRARGEQLGGRVRILRRTLPVRCLPADIPPAIEIDVTPVGLNEFVRASNVPLPEGVSLAVDGDFNVVAVVGKRVSAADQAALEAESGEAT